MDYLIPAVKLGVAYNKKQGDERQRAEGGGRKQADPTDPWEPGNVTVQRSFWHAAIKHGNKSEFFRKVWAFWQKHHPPQE